jgi:NTE family protein
MIKNSTSNTKNALVFQGGPYLGAFGCGVFKAFVTNTVKIDIVAATSAGTLNAVIIAGSKDDHPELALEQFWFELAESSNISSRFIRELKQHLRYSNEPNLASLKAVLSDYDNTNYADDKRSPRWRLNLTRNYPICMENHSRVYDFSPMIKTLERYVDYSKLRPDGHSNARLIITAVDILTGEPMLFDTNMQQITPRHLQAACGDPSSGSSLIAVENGLYGWDGSMSSYTPMAAVIDDPHAEAYDKHLFVIDNSPSYISNVLPENRADILQRTSDLMFTDRTTYSVRISKVLARYNHYIKELCEMFENNVDTSKVDQVELRKIRSFHDKIPTGEIKTINRITRLKSFFKKQGGPSLRTIKNSIKEGETKANSLLQNLGHFSSSCRDPTKD